MKPKGREIPSFVQQIFQLAYVLMEVVVMKLKNCLLEFLQQPVYPLAQELIEMHGTMLTSVANW